MILEVSPEAGWKWKIFTESSVIMLGEILWFWLNIMWCDNISRFFRDKIEIFFNLIVQDLFLLYLVFRDEIENLLYNSSDFEKGARNKTINSRGRARILDANSRETFRDREFSPMSALSVTLVFSYCWAERPLTSWVCPSNLVPRCQVPRSPGAQEPPVSPSPAIDSQSPMSPLSTNACH